MFGNLLGSSTVGAAPVASTKLISRVYKGLKVELESALAKDADAVIG